MDELTFVGHRSKEKRRRKDRKGQSKQAKKIRNDASASVHQ
jgi:hypothetical protein